MNQLSVCIMAVPSRKREVEELLKMIDYPVQISWDMRYQGVWYNAKKSYLNITPGSTHQLVLQDDVMVCKDFIPTVQKIIDLLPEEVISLYTPRSAALDLLKKDKHWLVWNTVGAPALIIPVPLIYRWMRWSEAFTDPTHVGEDSRLDLYMLAIGKKAWYPIPSIVQHREDLKSTIGNSFAKGRKSSVFLGTQQSGLSIDWSVGISSPAHWSYTYPDVVIKAYTGKINYIKES